MQLEFVCNICFTRLNHFATLTAYACLKDIYATFLTLSNTATTHYLLSEKTLIPDILRRLLQDIGAGGSNVLARIIIRAVPTNAEIPLTAKRKKL